MGTNSRQKGLVVLFSGAAALVVAAGAIACGNGDDDNSATPPPVVDGGGAVVTTTPIEKADAAALVIDGQMFALLQATNFAEENLSNVGLQQTGNPAIEAESITETFGQGLINDRLVNFAYLEGLSSLPTLASTSFAAAANTTITQLTPLTGAAFDSAYLAAQISLQQTVLNLLETQVLPIAVSYDMQTIATETRNLVQQHLSAMQALQADAGN